MDLHSKQELSYSKQKFWVLLGFRMSYPERIPLTGFLCASDLSNVPV